MKVVRLNTNPNIYSSNSYLVLGDWNKLGDINALIDTGTDDFIINNIEKINTGVGKQSVDKIIVTHNHFDHTGGIKLVKEKYSAQVYAYMNCQFVDHLLRDNDDILMGDCYFKVIHTPGHSSDSISLYCKTHCAVFTGDLNLRSYQADENFSNEYIESIEKLSKLKIDVVYPGHGNPIYDSPEKMINETLKNIKRNKHNRN